MSRLKRYSFCPSCQKTYDDHEITHNHYGPLICDECVEKREIKHNHSEEDVQDEVKRGIDQTIRRSYR